jgi:hypothetical protein
MVRAPVAVFLGVFTFYVHAVTIGRTGITFERWPPQPNKIKALPSGYIDMPLREDDCVDMGFDECDDVDGERVNAYEEHRAPEKLVASVPNRLRLVAYPNQGRPDSIRLYYWNSRWRYVPLENGVYTRKPQ